MRGLIIGSSDLLCGQSLDLRGRFSNVRGLGGYLKRFADLRPGHGEAGGQLGDLLAGFDRDLPCLAGCCMGGAGGFGRVSRRGFGRGQLALARLEYLVRISRAEPVHEFTVRGRKGRRRGGLHFESPRYSGLGLGDRVRSRRAVGHRGGERRLCGRAIMQRSVVIRLRPDEVRLGPRDRGSL